MMRSTAFLKVIFPIVLLAGHAQGSNDAPAVSKGVTGSVPTASMLVDLDHSDAVKTMHITMGRSLMLSTTSPLKRIYVGNPLVLQSFSAGPQEVVLTAKTYGLSNVVLWDMTGRSHMYSFSVDMDCEEVRGALGTAFPDLALNLETREGKLFLNGDVPSDAVLEAVMKMATGYSKDVVNGMRVIVPHGKQVELKLRIVEVDRSKAEQFGINFAKAMGNGVGGLSTQQFPSSITETPATATTPASVSVTDPLNLFLYSFNLHSGLTIKDLEQKHILQVLAEPTLTTMSGLAARFLSGGEFPVPVVQGGTGNSTAITVVYRPYGVKVDFTPTVNKDGTIHLKVAPEVSTLDYTNSVTLSGTTVPALSTRRAETEVEIRDGESFMVSGLLDHRVTDILSSVPGLGNLPLIGQLFRSKNISRSVVELVVLVTATVVDPLTHAPVPVEPVMAIPNMDTKGFDKEIQKIRKPEAIDLPAKQPATGPVAGVVTQAQTVGPAAAGVEVHVEAATQRGAEAIAEEPTAVADPQTPAAEVQSAKGTVSGKRERMTIQIAAVEQPREADTWREQQTRSRSTDAATQQAGIRLLHMPTDGHAEGEDAEALRRRLLNLGIPANRPRRKDETETR